MFLAMEPSPSQAPMDESSAFPPLEALRAVRQGFFEHLSTLPLPAVADPGSLPGRIEAAVRQLEQRTAHLVHNDLDRGNVGFALLAVAAFELLLPEVGQAEALRIVDTCLNQPL